MNAVVNIDVSIASRRRDDEQPFRPTVTNNTDIHYVTDLDSYTGLLSVIATDIINCLELQRSMLAENVTHIGVRLDNPTHPTPATGVVKLPKGHWDVSLSDLEAQTTSDIVELLSTVIGNLKNTAKY